MNRHWQERSLPATESRAAVRASLFALMFVAASCASSGSEGSASTQPLDDSDAAATSDSPAFIPRPGSVGPVTPPPDPAFPVSITEIDFDAGTITISNHGDDDVELGEIWICESPECEQLASQVVSGGEWVTLTDQLTSTADDGELALYRTDDFDNADEMLSYVEWGTTGHSRSTIAVDAELWGTDAVDSGLVIGTGGFFATDATRWFVFTSMSGEIAAPRPAPTTVPKATPPGGGSTSPPRTTVQPSPTPPAGTAPTAPPDAYSPNPPAAPLTTQPAGPPPPDNY